MSCISKELNNCWKTHKTAFVSMTAGTTVFAVSTLILTYFLITAPIHVELKHIISFSILNVTVISSFTISIMGLYVYKQKRKKELAEILRDLQNQKPILIKPLNLKHSAVASLDYIKQVRTDLSPLFTALGSFFQGFVSGYYQSIQQPVPDTVTVPAEIEKIGKEIDSFLQQPTEVLRAAIGIAAYTVIDPQKIDTLIKKSNHEFIASLSTTLNATTSGYEQQHELLEHILQVLASHANISDNALRDRINNLKEASEQVSLATTEDEKTEKMGGYKTALMSFIDYLYLKAPLSSETISLWTAYLVPPFLEQWRETLFSDIGQNMIVLSDAFKEGGIFNDSKWKAAVRVGLTFPGTLIYPTINQMLDVLPLGDVRKQALQKAVETLFPIIANPFFYATFEQQHPFRNKVENILTHMVLPDVQGQDWKAYIDAYCTFFNTLANQLQGESHVN